jgi:ATP-dependent helicase/nuclease subunit A
VALDFNAFQAMFATFESQRGAIDAYLRAHDGLAGAVEDVWKRLRFPLRRQQRRGRHGRGHGRARPRPLARRRRGAAGRRQDRRQVRRPAAGRRRRPARRFDQALAPLFTEKGAGTPATWVGQDLGPEGPRGPADGLLAEQDRLEEAREWVRAARVAEDSVDALRLAGPTSPTHKVEKAHARARWISPT